MSYNKRALMSILVIGIFCLLASAAQAEVVYKDGAARIQGATQDLKDIKDTSYLEIKDGICYLKKPVIVSSTGILKVNTTSCSKVNMYPNVVITVYGKIYFEGVKVTSYDPNTGQPIELSRTNYTKVRPDIVTRSSAQYFYANNSEFSYLGYYNPNSSHWGVALRFLPKADITNSKFHHNYFGFYTFDSDNVTIKDSEVYSNLEYGIDVHDFSDNFHAYNNVVYDNGNHGIILSKYNEDGEIMDNIVYDHTKNAFVKGVVKSYGTHGIELHQESNNTLISGNQLKNNRVGIKLAGSNDNTLTSNTIISDLEQGFYIDQSSNNQIIDNQVIESTKEPLYSFNSFYNYYGQNDWGQADDILYVKIQYEDGTIERHKFPAPGADAVLNSYSTPPESMTVQNAPLSAQNNAAIIPSIESIPLISEQNNEVAEVDVTRDKAIGIKSDKVRKTREEERAYVEKVAKYEREQAQKMEIKPGLLRELKKISPQDLEPNNEDVEADAVRDKKLSIKEKKARTKEEEKAYVEKIKKYEQEKAKKLLDN